MGRFSIGQQVGDGDWAARCKQRGDCLAFQKHAPEFVAVSGRERAWVTVDFELPVHEVDDPVVGDAGPRVGFCLLAPVFGERCVGHLHEQEHFRRGGVVVFVVPETADDDRDIRLGVAAEGEWTPAADTCSPYFSAPIRRT